MSELKLPSLGEGIEKGTVISIAVKVGDTIVKEQPILEVETDKVVVEVPADSQGIVTALLVNIGDEIAEGTPIIVLQEEGGVDAVVAAEPVMESEQLATAVIAPTISASASKTKTAITETKSKRASRELKLPSLGEGIEKGSVINIMVAPGDQIAAEQPLLEVETDKVVVEVPADFPGIIEKVLLVVGDEVSEGQPMFVVQEETGAGPIVAPTKKADNSFPEEKKTNKTVENKPPERKRQNPSLTGKGKTAKGFRASPLAKKIAREIGINLAEIPITEVGKRISVKDVKAYAKQLNQNRGTSSQATQMVLPNLSQWGEVRREAMTGIMQATSKNMTTSWSQIPHAWLQEKVDITYLEQQRQRHKQAVKEMGGALTITGILVKAMAKALEDFPIFNASIDTATNQLVYRKYINIGVAVDSDRGLLVPVLKGANTKTIQEIAVEMSALANKVKQRKIGSTDLEGATFTISNLGGIGTSAIFPLVSFPQVAILGVAASQTEAVWANNQFQPRLLMPLTIGFDHRLINGADAARFLQHVKSLLEDWFMWNL